jgi:hypothetical protein
LAWNFRLCRNISAGDRSMELNEVLLTPSSQSAHPLVLFCLFLFRVSAILLYILSGFFISNYVISASLSISLVESTFDFNLDRGSCDIARHGFLELSGRFLSLRYCSLLGLCTIIYHRMSLAEP